MGVERTKSSSSSSSSSSTGARYRRNWALLEPSGRREINLAQALGALAEYCLADQAETCRALVHRHLTGPWNNNDTAGVLAGGSDTVDIFRLVLQEEPENDDDITAAATTATTSSGTNSSAAGNELLHTFIKSPAGQPYQKILTVTNIQKYMLTMCQRWNDNNSDDKRAYHQLGNLMFILTWGPVPGQVRHIDDTAPNVQICLYMSDPCPSTILYTTTAAATRRSTTADDHDEASHTFTIHNVTDLVYFWEQQQHHTVPTLLRDTLLQYGDVILVPPQRRRRRRRDTTPSYCAWKSINHTLATFGKLYQPVQRVTHVDVDDDDDDQHHRHQNHLYNIRPGTTLVAAENFIHAGPPTEGPRMLLNAIGIPERRRESEEEDVERDGEVQYNPVTLHLDLTCILVSLWEKQQQSEQQRPGQDDLYEAKLFLLRYLVRLIRDGGDFYGQRRADVYDSILGDSRTALAEWLRSLVQVCLNYSNNHDQDCAVVVDGLLHRALKDQGALHGLFHVPHLMECRVKGRHKARRRVQKGIVSSSS